MSTERTKQLRRRSETELRCACSGGGGLCWQIVGEKVPEKGTFEVANLHKYEPTQVTALRLSNVRSWRIADLGE